MDHIKSENETQAKLDQILEVYTRKDKNKIQAELREGKVSLWGMVNTMAEKTFIGERIARIQGIKGVDNSLTVVMNGKITDQEIQGEIIKLFKNSVYPGLASLGCRVNKGVAVLLGHIETQDGVRKAVQMAGCVQGVKEVRSEIQMSLNRVDDATLVNRVEDAFVESPWVNAQEIKTTAHNGVVTLKGYLNNREDIEWAVDVAYQVPGVTAVVSDVIARHDSQGEDFQLTERLVGELGRHGLNSGQIRAFVREGIAYLSGQVYTHEQKEEAAKIGHLIPGIEEVSNGIHVNLHTIE